jgi:ribosomal protein S28E/S33
VPQQSKFELVEENFNQLSPAQTERLAILAEEMGEVVQIVGKILRHGYDSYHPSGGDDNRGLLELELGDVLHMLDRMTKAGDISKVRLSVRKADKAARIAQYLHHQGGK